MAETLIIGTSSSGKTVLVRQLRHLTTAHKKKQKKNVNSVISFETKPTVGVELDDIYLTKNCPHTLREVGAPMAPMWSAFYKGCNCVLFLVDSSNHSMLPEAAVELWHTLSSKNIRNKPILILGTKIDCPSLLSQEDIHEYLRVMELQENHSAIVDIMSVNLIDENDCMKVLEWLRKTMQ
jgi:GTPase SAR1 family protein